MDRLDSGKLTSVDHNGDRVTIIPAEVKGFFRRHRTWSQAILLVIFLALPWLKFRGLQTILIDIPAREFTLFGGVFRAHDVPLLFFILAILTLGLAFVISIWGRVWCGWACPQTVFIDFVYRRIEQWVEGSYIQRRKLRDQEMDLKKLGKLSLKWFLFLVVSSLIAHSFIAYFVSSSELIQMIQNPPSKNQTYFLLVTFFTAAILFDFGWFREQFCVIMCPYGRIQSVLLDSKSLAVVYDTVRGEPRKGTETPGQNKGDCVSCNRCVQVCPTGIDIRNGLQMECIACTACIDACDEIMTKVKKPTGLIRYETLDGSKISLLKPRSIIYMIAIAGLALSLTYALSTREPLHVAVLRGLGLPYSYVNDGPNKDLILNQFRLHIQNQSQHTAKYQLSIPAEVLPEGATLTVAENPISLKPKEFREWYFFVRTPQEAFIPQGQIKLKIQIEDVTTGFKTTRDLILIGPKQ